MIYRHLDKPKSRVRRLGDVPSGDWLVQWKPDGERCEISWRRGEPARIVSRHNKPLSSIAPRLDLELNDALASNPDLEQCRIDAEHVTPRRGARGIGEERFWLFDLLEYNDDPLYSYGAKARLNLLQCLVPLYLVVPSIDPSEHDLESFAAQARAHAPEVEGLVFKRPASRYVGSVRCCHLNPDWIKYKWPKQ